MSALGRAWAISCSISGPIRVGSSVGSTVGPRCQPSLIDSARPLTSKTRPVTPADSGLASQVMIGAIHRGDICSLASSEACPMPRFSVMRVSAAGAMALTVTP